MNEVQAAIQWADIVWLEGANEIAVQVTNDLPEVCGKKVVCRLHGYEVYTNMPKKINWHNIDRLIFVANHKREIFNQKFGATPCPQTIIRNGVHLENFTLAEDKRNTKKLVLLGHLNFRKGLPLLLHFFQQLLKRDSSYFLYIRGDFQDAKLELAAHTMIKEMQLSDNIEFVRWVHHLNQWFSDKSHILSFSLEESFHYAIGNGMAAGLKPVIHAWNESREIWPNQYIFKDLDEFLEMVQSPVYEPEHYRRELLTHKLDSRTQLTSIEKLLGDLFGGRTAEPAVSDSEKIIKIKQLQREWAEKSPYSQNEFEEYIAPFLQSGQIQTMKCERLTEPYSWWEVEFSIESEGKGAFVQFIIYDEHDRQIYFPFQISPENRTFIRKLVEKCIESPNIKLTEKLKGIIFNPKHFENIKNNFDEYVWERMHPCTVFSPLKGYFKHLRRYQFARQYLSPSDIVVDGACGMGYGTKYLSSLCAQIFAVDLSFDSLNIARRYYDSNRIRWIRADVTALPLPEKSIDCFISMETFEHIASPEHLLSEMKRVLKKGGIGIISTPNGQSARRKRIKNPFHTKEYSFEEVRLLCSQYFDHIGISGINAHHAVDSIGRNNEEYDNFIIRVQ